MNKKDFKKKVEETNKKVIEEKKKKTLTYSILDGSAWSVMAGFGESYLAPFAIALRATNQQIAMLFSLPQWLGSIFQLYSTKAMDIVKSRKKLINITVFLQALTWIPIFLLPFFFRNYSIAFLIFFVCFYWIFGQFAAPAWNSLMGDLVEENKRGAYFGRRNWISGFVGFVSVFIAGVILSLLSVANVWLGFFILFMVAMVSRFVSLYYLNLMYEPPYTTKKTDYFTFPAYLKRLRETNYGKFVIYVALITLAVQIAGPFFAVYMLEELNLSYLDYTIIVSAATVSTFISMVYWGRNIDKFGARNVLMASSIVLCIVPLQWLFSANVVYLVAIQLLAGFAWAGFNLAAFNFVFDTVKPGKRARCVAYQNVLNGSALFIGANLGGFLITKFSLPEFFGSEFKSIFLLSGVLRLLIVAFFLTKIAKIEEPRIESSERGYALFLQLVAIQPVQGLVYQATVGMRRSIRGIKNSIKIIDKMQLFKDKNRKGFKPKGKLKP